MVNLVGFEEQLSEIARYYSKIKELRESQKDDGIMIRIFLREIIPMYETLKREIIDSESLIKSVKEKLLLLVDWEMERAPGRDAVIEKFENEKQAVFQGEYEGELEENKKVEAPFASITEFYIAMKTIREELQEETTEMIISRYNKLKSKVLTNSILTLEFRNSMVALVDEEIRLTPSRNDEILKAISHDDDNDEHNGH